MRLAAALALTVTLAGCAATTPPPAKPAAATSSPTAPTPTPSASRTAVIQSEDLDVSYTPGGYCATNRLGKPFRKDGVTYTCKAPKPYRWRR